MKSRLRSIWKLRFVSAFTAFVALITFPALCAYAGSQSFTTPGTSNWTVPAGVTSVTVEAWGGGGAGGGTVNGANRGGGGAGGQYARRVVAVTPGASLAVVVGAGGTGGRNVGPAGGDSIFGANLVVAKGGEGGGRHSSTPPGGQGSIVGGVGDVVYRGGDGAAGSSSASGGGGGGAGNAANGNNASGATAGTGGTSGGGNGGAGRSNNGDGYDGSAPGGGGGGAYRNGNQDGGNGGNGRVVLSWDDPPSATTAAASNLTASGATLNGTVTSNGNQTTASFQYGTSTAYGSEIAATQSPLPAGAVNSAISATLTGLTCNTTYHFRAKAQNSVGTAYGSNLTFRPLCPTVVSINRASANPTVANASVSWSVVFSHSVTGVDLGDFDLVQSGGATGASLVSVTGSGTSWTVTANTGTASAGTLGLNLLDNDSIVSSGTPLGGAGIGNGNFVGQLYTIVPPAPILGKLSSTAAAVVGDVITFAVSARNPHAVSLADVVISDVLPSGMNYVAQVATHGTVSVTGQTVTWSIPDLPAGTTAQLTLAVRINQAGSYTNTVTSPGAADASAALRVIGSAVTHFRFDETAGSWNNSPGEVIDSGGTKLHGRRRPSGTIPTTTNVVAPSPTIASQHNSVSGGFCNAGRFDGNAVVEVADSPNFDYTTQLSATAWVYPTAYPSSGLSSILSNDTNYEFHITPSGKLNWWWNSDEVTSDTTVPLNQWSHIAITFNSASGVRRQRIYINGVLDKNTKNWQGSLQANNCPFYIGGDISTGSNCAIMPERNFKGMIDEVKLYNYELDASEVAADMTLGRQCSGTFDHIRIEHDGTGSICAPEQVTVKACMDAACSMLYPGNVDVRLTPTGWVGGDSFTISGGIGSRKLSRTTAGDVTLGVGSATPSAANAVRCFKGGTESCVMNFATASCAFDAVEKNGAPQDSIFTKLAGQTFNLDVLALSNATTINQGYSGSVVVDLVDASTSSCPTSSGLTTTQNISFAAADKGRKNVSFTYDKAAANVRVRMKVGTGTPACSSDNFAIRPQAFTVTSTNATNTGSAGTPVFKAGADSFNLTASTGVAGYNGTPTIDGSKVIGSPTQGSINGTFGAANAAGSASGNSFTYSEVGNFGLDTNAVYDDTFTLVDKPDDCTDDFSNSLVGQKYGCKIGSVKVEQTTDSSGFGRFIPDHFKIEIRPGCTDFTYSGQPFPVTLTAMNKAGFKAENYSGDYAKVVALTETKGAAGGLGNATVDADKFASGVAHLDDMDKITATTADDPIVKFTFNAKLTAPARIALRAKDSDGVSSEGYETGAETEIRSGRLRLTNAFGTVANPPKMPVRTQYWSGNSWINIDDACTKPTTSQFSLDPSKATPTLSTSEALGPWKILFANPNKGTAKVCAGLDDDLSWLKNVDGSNPCARVTFGVYPAESKKTVHIRELY